ncbi:hypothetical protein [Brevundimonas goettingensis]|uniref:Uncharacterized protein n=1 Tax=Brevundimonas goettingensis TaxID=2774190 RepID=A0A975GVD7_9CAUL|nr:hypothetical protein [Brevundimonas goettingensis]QTC91301.1 hypothetical protein IFJ75_19235 [Brevundimonas goettingensis]
MNSSPPTSRWPTQRSPAVRIAGFLVLGLIGGAAGLGIATLSKQLNTGWEDTLALGAGAAPLVMAAIIALGLITKRGAEVMKGCGGLQVLVMLLAGAMMLLPMVGARIAAPELVMAALAVMLVVQAGANLLLWRRADEMLRRIMAETATLAFWTLQSALFLYAAAERLGLIQGLTAWGMMGILMGVYFVASAIAAARRGIH